MKTTITGLVTALVAAIVAFGTPGTAQAATGCPSDPVRVHSYELVPNTGGQMEALPGVYAFVLISSSGDQVVEVEQGDVIETGPAWEVLACYDTPAPFGLDDEVCLADGGGTIDPFMLVWQDRPAPGTTSRVFSPCAPLREVGAVTAQAARISESTDVATSAPDPRARLRWETLGYVRAAAERHAR
eukprot:g14890.t1